MAPPLYFTLPNRQNFLTLWTFVKGVRAASGTARNKATPAPRHQRQQTTRKNRPDTRASFHTRHDEILAIRAEKVNWFPFYWQFFVIKFGIFRVNFGGAPFIIFRGVLAHHFGPLFTPALDLGHGNLMAQ